MHLVQLLLPVFDNEGQRFPEGRFAEVRHELTAEFGGVTAYLRSPATGLWQRENGEVDRDEMVMFETMVDRLDGAWWRTYRSTLEARFSQDVIVARAIEMRLL
jgi:hypothetical protein